MNYDHKLREAMFEIQGVLDKHQVIAFVLLNSKTHSEFKFFWPLWSLVRNEGVEGFRVKFKKGIDSIKDLESSVGSLLEMKRMSAHCFMMLDHILKELSKVIKIHYEPSPINNDNRGES